MKGGLALVSLVWLFWSAAAMADDLPKFALCMDQEVARYERALAHAQTAPDVFNIGDARGIEVCGTAAIMICDASDAPLPCQRRLAAEQQAWRAAVLATLPAPDAVAGQAGEWSGDLYPRFYAMAHDRSAGPDCAGTTEVMQVWCEAREANRRLERAVLAWQLARYMNATPDAVNAGWAQVPPPQRPQARKPAQTQD